MMHFRNNFNKWFTYNRNRPYLSYILKKKKKKLIVKYRTSSIICLDNKYISHSSNVFIANKKIK